MDGCGVGRRPRRSSGDRQTPDMDPTEAIRAFLSHALRKERRDRYLFLVERRKGRKRFLADLYHAMGEQIDTSRAVPSIADEVLSAPAYSYSERGGFGRARNAGACAA